MIGVMIMVFFVLCSLLWIFFLFLWVDLPFNSTIQWLGYLKKTSNGLFIDVFSATLSHNG
jgi:hypothetical protein